MTALAQMAAVRPPGIADARVPCPLCGGLIHPVAGRCKHCKEDLSSFRAGRPQAAAALPALLNGKLPKGSNGHPLATANAVVPVTVETEGSQPILPPRTTARSIQAQQPSHSIWKSWPMLVIVLAVIAIVAATVIMIIPPGSKKHDGKMSAPPGPAFERMETNPMPDKSSQLDPWDNGTGGPQGAVPRAPDPQPQAPTPVDPDDDLLGGNGGGIGGGGIAGGTFGMQGNAMMIHVLDRACKKLKSCPDLDQSSLSTICDSVAMMPKPTAPTCAAAQRCFDAIDRLSCSQASAQSMSPLSVFGLFRDCSDADNC